MLPPQSTYLPEKVTDFDPVWGVDKRPGWGEYIIYPPSGNHIETSPLPTRTQGNVGRGWIPEGKAAGPWVVESTVSSATYIEILQYSFWILRDHRPKDGKKRCNFSCYHAHPLLWGMVLDSKT